MTNLAMMALKVAWVRIWWQAMNMDDIFENFGDIFGDIFGQQLRARRNQKALNQHQAWS